MLTTPIEPPIANRGLFYTHCIKSTDPKFVLVIGGAPKSADQIKGFHAVINVSDAPCLSLQPGGNQVRLWFPLIERGVWPYAILLAFKKAMDALVTQDAKIFVHCHAGLLRSPVMAGLWLESVRQPDLVPTAVRSDIAKLLADGRLPKDIREVFQKANRLPNATLIEFGYDKATQLMHDSTQFFINEDRKPCATTVH